MSHLATETDDALQTKQAFADLGKALSDGPDCGQHFPKRAVGGSVTRLRNVPREHPPRDAAHLGADAFKQVRAVVHHPFE